MSGTIAEVQHLKIHISAFIVAYQYLDLYREILHSYIHTSNVLHSNQLQMSMERRNEDSYSLAV